jgi:hypothetical protein
MHMNFRAKRALSHGRQQWNGFAYAKTAIELLPQVHSRLKSHCIVIDDNEILVIECGFVTMAIHADRAVVVEDAVVVPGVDCRGQRGFLVLRENAVPFHSLASSAIDACRESDRANQKANALLTAYGDKNNLRLAARKAPWYQLVTEEDLISSGLCMWGSESFLRRFGLLNIARRFGLPRLILRLAGPYGDRVVAASLLRAKHHRSGQILGSGS